MIYVACAVLSVIVVLMVLYIVLYRYQIGQIASQMDFLAKNTTNMEITQTIKTGEINQLIDNFNGIIGKFKKESDEMLRKDMQLKETITSISHDIRTPLTSLNGYFELLSVQCRDVNKLYPDAVSREYIEVINDRIICLKEMLEQLFTYVKLQNDEYSLETEKFDICAELCDTLVGFYEEFRRNKIEPVINVPDDMINVSLNRLAVRRSFENIIKNAVEHGDGKFYTDLSISEKTGGKGKADEIIVIIGNGIPPQSNIDRENVGQVFERFYKADLARSQNSTGLGLAIAHDMIVKMGGRIIAHITDDNMFEIRISFDLERR